MTDETIARTVDLTKEGADGLGQFIAQCFDNDASDQAFVEIETDDGVVITKAELVFDGDFYRLRLSGL